MSACECRVYGDSAECSHELKALTIVYCPTHDAAFGLEAEVERLTGLSKKLDTSLMQTARANLAKVKRIAVLERALREIKELAESREYRASGIARAVLAEMTGEQDK